jgi:drug/metabolite transporter (DMT)-like permease
MSPGAKLAEANNLKRSINPLWYALPALCDCCGSALMFVSLTMCAASVYQMLRGVIVIITAALAFFFLGQKQYPHHFLAMFFIIAGAALVGYAALNNPNDDHSSGGSETKPLGIIVLLIA